MGVWTPSEQRRAEIIEAAMGLLARTSLEALTTRALAKALGLSQPALFRHFRTREALLLAVVARARADMEKIAESVLAVPADAPVQLRRLGESLLAHVERTPGLPRLLFGAAGPAEGTVRDALRPIVSMQESLAAELVRKGQRGGQLAPDAAPEAAATLFVGTLQGLVLTWELAGRPPGLPDRFAPCFALWLRALDPTGVPPSARVDVPSPAPTGARGAALVALDVRPILARGVDPLAAILAALEALPAGGVLVLTAPFRPAPLLALLQGRGARTTVERLADDRYFVLIVDAGGPAIEDLRDLEPPEPLERVLVATAALGPGAVHVARTPRAPRLLVERLGERSVRCEILELPDASALVRVEGAP